MASDSDKHITRRQALKRIGAVAATAITATALPLETLGGTFAPPYNSFGSKPPKNRYSSRYSSYSSRYSSYSSYYYSDYYSSYSSYYYSSYSSYYYSSYYYSSYRHSSYMSYNSYFNYYSYA